MKYAVIVLYKLTTSKILSGDSFMTCKNDFVPARFKKKFTIRTAGFSMSFFMALMLSLPAAQAGDFETAQDLTTLLRAARAVTVNRTTIADPGKFDVQKFIQKTRKKYKRASGKELDKSDFMLAQLMTAATQVINNAKDGKYKNKWPSGDYANKFLPARFARETGLEFSRLTNGKASIKLTTSNALLVNFENKADSWENDAIESKFLTSGWERNKVFEEDTSNGYRLILPEYYKTGCLKCHGGDKGKRIHAGKVSGHLGEFGGAISVILR